MASTASPSVRRFWRQLVGLHDDTAATTATTSFGQASAEWGDAGETMLRAAQAPTAHWVLQLMDSRSSGLTATEAAERLERYGPNMVTTMKSPAWYKVLFWAFLHPFNVLLLLLATVAAATGDMATLTLLVAMVILSVTTRFIQEMRSYRAVESLRKKAVIYVKVLRSRGSTSDELSGFHTDLAIQPPPVSTSDSAAGLALHANESHELLAPYAGHPHDIRSVSSDETKSAAVAFDVVDVLLQDLVPGDVVSLSSGDIIPADVRLLTHRNLLINQAALTGESVAVEKSTSAAAAEACDAGNTLEWSTCCLTGTSVETGICTAVVVLTGDKTFFGMNAKLLAKTTPATAFDRGVKRVSFMLMAFMLVMVPIVIVLNGASTGSWPDAALFGVAVAVGLTPEMLPMIVNTNLARAAVTLSRRHVIVKRLQAVQNVGAMNVLCTDKTGTLTEDHVVVEHSRRASDNLEERPDVLATAGLAAHHVVGNRNAIDRAILEAFEVPGVPKTDNDNPSTVITIESKEPATTPVSSLVDPPPRPAPEQGLVSLSSWVTFRDMFSLVGVVSFDFSRRRSSAIVRHVDQPLDDYRGVLVCKGAVDEVLSVCTTFETNTDEVNPLHEARLAPGAADGRRASITSIHRNGAATTSKPALPTSMAATFGLGPSQPPPGIVLSPLTDNIRAEILQKVDSVLHDGYRVLLVAYRWIDCPATAAKPRANNAANDDEEHFSVAHETDLVLRGMLILRDRPKTTARTAIRLLQNSYIRIKVLTGDNEIVATQVCRDVGLNVSGVVTGQKLAKLEPADKVIAIRDGTIFARLTPAQKAEVVQILQSENNTVGFLGDGINDALALRQADVGISVDCATEVARDAADLILLEKDLNVIQTAVVEGRRTHGNTIKYIKMAASSNFGNVFSVLIASAWLPYLPMLPQQLLTQNLLYDFSQLAIPWDYMDDSYLVKPRPWDAGSMVSFMVCIGPISSLFDVGTFLFGWYYLGDTTADSGSSLQSCWFTLGLSTQALIVHAIRTEKIPFFQSVAAPIVCLTTFVIIVLAIAIPYTPIGVVLDMVPLPPMFFAYLFAANLTYFVLAQVNKTIYIRYFKKWL